MIRPDYIKNDYRYSRYARDLSRLLFSINEPGSEIIGQGETVNSILFALQKGGAAFHVSSSDSDGIKSLSKALKEWKGKTPFISLGVGEISTEGPDSVAEIFDGQSTRRIVINSLENIGSGMIDLLVLNDPPLLNPSCRDEIHDLVADLRKTGLVNMTGVGYFRPHKAKEVINSDFFDFVWGMNRLNACNLDARVEDIPVVKTGRWGYINSSVLHMSLLGNRLGQYSREGAISNFVSERDIKVAVMASRIARKNHMTISEMAYRYAFSMDDSDIVVASTGDIEHMEAVIRSWERGPLSKELFNTITSNTLAFYT